LATDLFDSAEKNRNPIYKQENKKDKKKSLAKALLAFILPRMLKGDK
jgi:hypothetical protein